VKAGNLASIRLGDGERLRPRDDARPALALARKQQRRIAAASNG